MKVQLKLGVVLMFVMPTSEAAQTQMTRAVYAYVSSDGEQLIDQGAIVKQQAQMLDLHAIGTGLHGDALATMTGSVDFGHISFRQESTASSNRRDTLSWSQTGLEMSWQDELLLESDTLSMGTPVAFQIFGSLHRGLMGNHVGGPQNVGGFISGGGQAYHYAYPGSCGADATPCMLGEVSSSISSGILQAAIGEWINIGAAAGGVTWASVGLGGRIEEGTSTQIIDATNTARFAIQLLTPGASYRAASGTRYSSSLDDPPTVAVESPAPWTLFVASVVCQLLAGRGCRRQCGSHRDSC